MESRVYADPTIGVVVVGLLTVHFGLSADKPGDGSDNRRRRSCPLTARPGSEPHRPVDPPIASCAALLDALCV